jgi:hypothetical protein
MSRLGLRAVSRFLWPIARRPLQAIARAISAEKRRLMLAEARVQRRIEARLRELLLVFALAMAGLVLGSAGAVFLLVAIWGGLAALLGPIGASLTLAVVLLGGSIPPLAMAVRRAKMRRHAHD